MCRMSVRSTDATVIEPIAHDPARWIEELCGRTMVEGINAGRWLSLAAEAFAESMLSL